MALRLSALVLPALLLCLSLPVAAGILDGQRGDEFLDVDEAFRASVSVEDDTLLVTITAAPEHYLYRHALAFSVPENSNSVLGEPQLPTGEKETDDFFGEIETYRGVLEARLPIVEGGVPGRLQVRYQGCADAGLCYPPQQKLLDTGSGMPLASADEPAASGFESEQDRLAGQLASGNRAWAMITFLGLGLLLAFTPCVLPMIPILSGIIVGANATAARALLLSGVYVFAMALAYTVFGVLAGLFGSNLQAALQSAWTLLPFAALFVALALAMFGLFELAVPAGFQQRLSGLAQGRSGLVGAAILGFTSALIVGPCLAPPLAGALLYIGGTGDAVFGGAALFALGIGMGIPLMLLSVFGAGLLPRAGDWMRQINVFFGVVLLGVAIWLMQRLLPNSLSLILWAALAGGYAVYLLRMRFTSLRVTGGVLALYAVALVAGALLGGRGPLSPLPYGGIGGSGSSAESQVFERVASVAALEEKLAQARNAGQPVVLDFYADWCVECVEMEHGLFQRASVRSALGELRALQVDVTDYDEADRALMKSLGVIGPPTILFYDGQGKERRQFRLIGKIGAEEFVEHMRRAGVL